MRRALLFVAALWVAACALAAVGRADTNYPELDKLASHWAQRPVHVDCPTPDDWAADWWAQGAWGYTDLYSNETRVDPTLCAAALSVARGPAIDEDWRAALSVLVITHEALHLRNWKWNWNEARVECAAIRSWPEAFLMLSRWRFDGQTLWRLASFALAEHYQLASEFPEYRLKGCRIGWWPPWR